MSLGLLGHIARSNQMIGLSIVNKAEVALGTVDSIAFDVARGEVPNVVVLASGVLNERSVIPSQALRFNSSREALVLDDTPHEFGEEPRLALTEAANGQPATPMEESYKAPPASLNQGASPGFFVCIELGAVSLSVPAMTSVLPLIVHLDADAFFVSVELALQPQYRGKKVAVGGRERGIIASASYEARACGVYTPMPTTRALKVCPDLILLPHKGSYGEVSRKMFDLCETLTPYVERKSIDEGYLDLGPCGLKSLVEIERVVRGLQKRIWDELQIPVSMGIATNKLVSQIASKLRKPRGFVVVEPGAEAAFLERLDIGKLPGVGTKTEEALQKRGVWKVRDLFNKTERELASLLGSDWRAFLEMARGVDQRPVDTEREEAKSYSQQETFSKDIGDFTEIERVAKGMIDALMPAIRADGKRVKTMTVKVRYGDFTQETAGRSLPEASDLEQPFYPLVAELLRKAWTLSRPLRLVSVRFSGVEDGGRQLEMFAQTDEKRRKLAAVMDRLNQGKTTLVKHGHQLPGRKRARE